MRLVVIRNVPLEVFESYLNSIPTAIYNGEDAVFPHDCLELVTNHPMTADLMSEEDIDFNVEVVEY